MKRNKRWMQIIILSMVILVGALTIALNLFSDHKTPLVGDQAPNFKLLGLDGKVHQLSDYKGKNILINFWGTYCKPCKDEMPAIQQQYAKWGEANFVVLGVNMGENAITARGFAESVKVQFPILLDESEEIRKRYGVINYPTSFFIKSNGTIVKIMVGSMAENFIEESIASLLSNK